MGGGVVRPRNFITYQCDASVDALLDAVSQQQLQEPSAPQWRSTGWLPPRGVTYEMGYRAQGLGFGLVMHGRAERVLPGAVIRERVNAACKQFARDRGFQPSRKIVREIRDQTTTELLAQAFIKTTATPVIVDAERARLHIAVASHARAEEIASELRRQADARITPFSFSGEGISLTARMGQWLACAGPPHGFDIESQECELRGTSTSGEAVVYKNHSTTDPQVSTLLTAGFCCSRLSLSWQDRARFVLHEDGRITKLTLFTESDLEGDEMAAWEADAQLLVGELRGLTDALSEAAS